MLSQKKRLFWKNVTFENILICLTLLLIVAVFDMCYFVASRIYTIRHISKIETNALKAGVSGFFTICLLVLYVGSR